MSDGSIIKAEKDFTKETDAAIPEAEKLAEVQTSFHLPYAPPPLTDAC